MKGAARDLGPAALVAGVLILLGATALVGADTMWAVALGRATIAQGQPPVGVPFAAAPSAPRGTPVLLGALLLTMMDALGQHALVTLLMGINSMVLATVLVTLRLSAISADRQAIAMWSLALAGLATFGVARLPMLSLLPFLALVLILRHQADRPDGAIWWSVPLIALWGNLHGGVIIGLAVLGSYLVGARLRSDPRTAVAVLVASIAALLANPAGVRTVDYVRDVFGNEAAARGSDLWSRPNMSSAIDVLMMAGLAVLALLWARSRPRLWEYLLIAGLGLATALAARNGIWLALACVLLITDGRRARAGEAVVARTNRLVGRTAYSLVGIGVVVAVILVSSRGSATAPPGEEVAHELVAATEGKTVLAAEPLVETLAARGARVWLCNPIDSFARVDQAEFLDFLQGLPSGRGALKDVDVVIAEPTSPQAQVALDAGFVPVAQIGPYVLLETRPRASST